MAPADCKTQGQMGTERTKKEEETPEMGATRASPESVTGYAADHKPASRQPVQCKPDPRWQTIARL